MLPNFLIIGTMKGGTTSLYNYLRAHPQVFMPTQKELHYFVAAKNLSRGIGWYERNFRDADGAVAVGEASPDYTKNPIHEGVAERIATVVPRARLIYLVRNPLERIRSHYLHDRAAGRERRPIAEAVDGNPHYLAPSMYAMQIEQYLPHFPREQLLVVASEELRHDRRPTLRRVYEFLGVDADWSAHDEERDFHETSAKTAPGVLVRAARKVPGARRLRLLAPGAVGTAERLLRRSGDRLDLDEGRMSDELRQRLTDTLAGDLERFRRHVGNDFDAWGLT